MDYADKLLMESRNNVNFKADYTHSCRCWGKCFDELKKGNRLEKINPTEQKIIDIIGAKEVYYGPWRDFFVKERGIWTTIKCPVCGYTEFWALGDGDARF